jgi:hypothetical protein
MIRPRAGPSNVSNLRHRQRQSTLAVMLALVGTVACGGEGATGPTPRELAESAKQWTAPTGGSLMLQSEADATRAEVENSRLGVNDLIWQMYGGIAEIASRDQWFPAPSEGPPPNRLNVLAPAFSEDHHPSVISQRMLGAIRGGKGGRPPKPSALWAIGECPIGQSSCATECKFYKDEMIRAARKRQRSASEGMP